MSQIITDFLSALSSAEASFKLGILLFSALYDKTRDFLVFGLVILLIKKSFPLFNWGRTKIKDRNWSRPNRKALVLLHETDAYRDLPTCS
jgi:hypothetical protein